MFGMGSAYINNGRYNEGFEILQKAYELEPKYDQAKRLYILSSIYAGKEELIEELFGSIVESGVMLDMNFVNAYSKIGEKTKALQVLEILVENNPENVQYHISLAATYFENGQNSKSIIELEKAIELDPNFKEQGEKFLGEIKTGERP